MSNRKQLVLLNGIAISFYLIIWIWLGFELSEQAMFFTNDSNDYLSVANWIFSGSETNSTLTRPVLYPALIGLPYFVFGVVGIWVLQFACWLLTINLTFLSVKKWTNNQPAAWVSASVVMINLSFIAMTFQGLTEVMTTAFLSLLCYQVVSNIGTSERARFGHRLLFVFVILTLVKPLFYYPTLLCLVLTLFVYRKEYQKLPKKLIYPFLIILPILLQMSIVQVKHGSFTVSKIGGLTFKNYYFSKCVRNIEKIEDTQESIAFTDQLSSDEKKDYFLQHKSVFVTEFIENIVVNIKAPPAFLDSDYVRKFNASFAFMQGYNNVSLLIHVLGTILLIPFFIVAFLKRDKQTWIPLFCIGGLTGYMLLTSGVSFWQGDRLLLPSIALWIPLYTALFFMTGSKFLKRRDKSNAPVG